ncbi:hypothetical protein BV898_20042 [Hypsibius exemplaris]|uniref:Uncharacterized protein n=1 Tax=Hypsibius exemplaris TaxID=2072580 RepID=A0A9X6RPH9_HYPEX|nr:hypothetical protein BV898_20042 [Hypsibius exemplaris]
MSVKSMDHFAEREATELLQLQTDYLDALDEVEKNHGKGSIEVADLIPIVELPVPNCEDRTMSDSEEEEYKDLSKNNDGVRQADGPDEDPDLQLAQLIGGTATPATVVKAEEAKEPEKVVEIEKPKRPETPIEIKATPAPETPVVIEATPDPSREPPKQEETVVNPEESPVNAVEPPSSGNYAAEKADQPLSQPDTE